MNLFYAILGHVCVMSRLDDVINVAGHRLSCGLIEEIVLEHNSIVDCATIGVPDRLRGSVPVAICVLRDGKHIQPEASNTELHFN